MVRTHNKHYKSAVDISGERLYVDHSLIKYNTSMACKSYIEEKNMEKAEQIL